MSDGPDRRRPSISASFSNWKGHDGPLTARFRLFAQNNWKKLRTRQNCCGNGGEPGC